jgi:hypothetical protein
MQSIGGNSQIAPARLPVHNQADNTSTFQNRIFDQTAAPGRDTWCAGRRFKQDCVQVQAALCPSCYRDAVAHRETALRAKLIQIITDTEERRAADGIGKAQALQGVYASRHDPFAAGLFAWKVRFLEDFDAQPAAP